MNSSLDPSVIDQTSKECEICHAADWKYTCPRCLIHTCSVLCVKKHKVDTQCSGERDKTAYVPLKAYNESTMMNDYTYLEDVSRQSDNLTRARREFISKNMKSKLKQLHKQANHLGIKYFSLPVGMTRHTKNQSNYNLKARQIYWTIEVNFYRNDEKHHYLEHGFPGNRPFHDFFHNMLFSETPRGKDSFSIMRHELKYFIDAGLDQFRIALKKEKAPRGEFVDVTGILDMSFLDTLRGETVVEYPTFYVWLKDDPQPSDILSLEEKRVLIRPLKRTHEEVDEKEQEEKRLKVDEENEAEVEEEENEEKESKFEEEENSDITNE